MGWGFRKSISFGPLRVNFSKSGIGLSAGVRGARVSTGPRGSYVHLGSGGVYYRQKIQDFGNIGDPSAATAEGKAHNLHVASNEDSVLSQINDCYQRYRLLPFAVAGFGMAALFVMFVLLTTQSIWALLLLIGVVGSGIYASYLAKQRDDEACNSTLTYDLQEPFATRFWRVGQAIQILAGNHGLWFIETRHGVSDWKRNSGASSTVNRRRARADCSSPPSIKINVIVPRLDIGLAKVFFLPDRVLLLSRGRYSGIHYDAISVACSDQRFIEDGWCPPDAEHVGSTWRYVNRNGGPDKRFSNNAQLPILQYGELVLSSMSGLVIVLQASNRGLAYEFARTMAAVRTMKCT